jgi:TPR repeat protein
LKAGNSVLAPASYEREYRLGNLEAGFRLVDMYSRGLGAREDPRQVFALFSDLAERGEVKALHRLGVCYEHGFGVPADMATAPTFYRKAADQGDMLAIYTLGVMSAEDRKVPRDDVEGLACLLRVAARATGDDPSARFMRENLPKQTKLLMERMSLEDISLARARAAASR